MIDFQNLGQYRENNRIEAKQATGGLPRSLWETYSAFANTLGGIILLGVEERRDKTLRAFGLLDPDWMVQEFWELVNDPATASVNILSEKHVRIETVEGRQIVAVTVPRAQRADRPVYVHGDRRCTYRRNGEGDYRCTREEIQSMLRDAAVRTQDMQVLEEMDESVFNGESVRSYRTQMSLSRPGHAWEELDDAGFLSRLGAMAQGKDGLPHPTAAGLLMFGDAYDIVRVYPRYFLGYREQPEGTERRTNRFASSAGDWSGNLYDFYIRVYRRLIRDRQDNAPVCQALREALANCIVNADYHGFQGLVVVRKHDRVIFSNPGSFRVDVEEARSGGVSDPRNGTLMKMFTLIDVAERAGSDIPGIYAAWMQQGWPEPVIEERFEPERTDVTIFTGGTPSRALPAPGGHRARTVKVRKRPASHLSRRRLILDYLTEHPSAKLVEISKFINLRPPRTRKSLNQLILEGFVEAEGEGRDRMYRLKA